MQVVVLLLLFIYLFFDKGTDFHNILLFGTLSCIADVKLPVMHRQVMWLFRHNVAYVCDLILSLEYFSPGS